MKPEQATFIHGKAMAVLDLEALNVSCPKEPHWHTGGQWEMRPGWGLVFPVIHAYHDPERGILEQCVTAVTPPRIEGEST